LTSRTTDCILATSVDHHIATIASMHPFGSIIALGVLLSLLLATTVQASAIRRTAGAVPVPRNTLVPRQLVTSAVKVECQDLGSTACNIRGASFCCPAQTECIPLENNTAVICCNVNEVCAEIHPVACPATQDETKIQPKCGDDCCPFGFECDPSGTKCLMKEANLPEKYRRKDKPVPDDDDTSAPVAGDGDGDGQTDEDTDAEPTPSTTPLLGVGSDSAERSSSCADFPAKAIVVGFFPGMVAGVALLLLWTKLVEERTRRRSIKSFGVFTSFPSEANLTEKKPASVTKKPSFPVGFVVQPQRESEPSSSSKHKLTFSPMSDSFRSPNLGPIIMPLSPPIMEHFTRLAPRPASRRRDSDAVSVAVSLAFSDSAVVDFVPPAPLNPRRKRHSVDTGYSASVYNDGNESRPFDLDTRNEVAIPPVPKPAPLFYRQFGVPMPRPPVPGWTGARV